MEREDVLDAIRIHAYRKRFGINPPRPSSTAILVDLRFEDGFVRLKSTLKNRCSQMNRPK